MQTTAHAQPRWGAQLALSLGALGIVFGDIGTSPLYALRECIASVGADQSRLVAMGSLSLIFWALVFEVCFKYLWAVMRADNHGEGGIFALLALSHGENKPAYAKLGGLLALILFGAALLYGDGVITPAISVLSAAEGFKSIHAGFTPYITLIACAILGGLFWAQHKGTHSIGRVFGPIMAVWFVSIGGIGLWHIAHEPQILAAINPWYGWQLVHTFPLRATALFGAVVLAITGAEALYADMGHFGHRPIAWAWYAVAFPGLILNYFGQGAYALQHPQDVNQLFFALVPEGLPRLALVGLSIAAAVIASQALISGTFSLTRQAIQLGLFPRLKVVHTNARHEGQIYLPLVNWALAVGAIFVVLSFKSSDALAAAYGIAVTGTMVITSLAFFDVALKRWHWPLWKIAPLCGLFIVVEIAFFYANLHKIGDGGWLPLVLAAGIFTVMHTWKIGRQHIAEHLSNPALRELDIVQVAQSKTLARVPGSAIFMVSSSQGVPLALLHHLKANKCLQHTVVLLTIINEEIPVVDATRRLEVLPQGAGIWRAIGRYGYMETPDVASLCEQIQTHGVPLKLGQVTVYFNREMILSGGPAPMFDWQKNFYAFLSRNARPVKDYYGVMPSQVIEIGLPIKL